MTGWRRRLTPHQRDVLADLRLRSRLLGGDWVNARDIGSRSALEHLVAKGWADVEDRRGIRGGIHRFYRPKDPS